MPLNTMEEIMSARRIQSMLSIAVGCVCLATLASSAQEMLSVRSVAALPSAAATVPVATTDIRQVLSDFAMRNPPGLAENAWDFNAPDGVPGFAPLPAREASPARLAHQ
jgi:hypothetical protein